MPKKIDNESGNWRDWSARKLCDEYGNLPDKTRDEIDEQLKVWVQKASEIAHEVEQPFRAIYPDYNRKDLRSRSKLVARIASFVNMPLDKMDDLPMDTLRGIADAVVDVPASTQQADKARSNKNATTDTDYDRNDLRSKTKLFVKPANIAADKVSKADKIKLLLTGDPGRKWTVADVAIKADCHEGTVKKNPAWKMWRKQQVGSGRVRSGHKNTRGEIEAFDEG